MRRSFVTPPLSDYLKTKRETVMVSKKELNTKLTAKLTSQERLSKFYNECTDTIERVHSVMRSARKIDPLVKPLLTNMSTIVGATGAYLAKLDSGFTEATIIAATGTNSKYHGKVFSRTDGGVIWQQVDKVMGLAPAEAAEQGEDFIPPPSDSVDLSAGEGLLHIRHAMDLPEVHFFGLPADGAVVVAPIVLPNLLHANAFTAAANALESLQDARAQAEASDEAEEVAKREAAEAARLAKLKPVAKAARGKAAPIPVAAPVEEEEEAEEPEPLENPFSVFGSDLLLGPADVAALSESAAAVVPEGLSQAVYVLVVDTIGDAPRFPVPLPASNPDGQTSSAVRSRAAGLSPSRFDADKTFTRTQLQTIREVAALISAQIFRSQAASLVRGARVRVGLKRSALPGLFEAAQSERTAKEDAVLNEIERVNALAAASSKAKAKAKAKATPVAVPKGELSEAQKDGVRNAQLELYEPVVQSLTSLLLAYTDEGVAFNDAAANGEWGRTVVALLLQAGFKRSDLLPEWGTGGPESFGPAASPDCNLLNDKWGGAEGRQTDSLFQGSEILWAEVRRLWSRETLTRLTRLVKPSSGTVGPVLRLSEEDEEETVVLGDCEPSLHMSEIISQLDEGLLDETFMPWGEMARWLKVVNQCRRAQLRVAAESAEDSRNNGLIIRTLGLSEEEEYQRIVEKPIPVAPEVEEEGEEGEEENDETVEASNGADQPTATAAAEVDEDEEGGEEVDVDGDEDAEEQGPEIIECTRNLTFEGGASKALKNILIAGGKVNTSAEDAPESTFEVVESFTDDQPGVTDGGRKVCIVWSALEGTGVAVNRPSPKDAFQLDDEEEAALRQQVEEGGARLVVIADAPAAAAEGVQGESKAVQALNKMFGWRLKSSILQPQDALGHLAVSRVPIQNTLRFPLASEAVMSQLEVATLEDARPLISEALAEHNPQPAPMGIPRAVGPCVLLDESTLPSNSEVIASSSLVDAALIRVGRGNVLFVALPLAKGLTTPPPIGSAVDVDEDIARQRAAFVASLASQPTPEGDAQLLTEEDFTPSLPSDGSDVDVTSYSKSQLRCTTEAALRAIEAVVCELAAARKASPGSFEGPGVPSAAFLERAEKLERAIAYLPGSNPLSVGFEGEETELDWADILAQVDAPEEEAEDLSPEEEEAIEAAARAAADAAAVEAAQKAAAKGKAKAAPKRSAAAQAAALAEEKARLEREAAEKQLEVTRKEMRAKIATYHRERRLRYRVPFIPSYRVARQQRQISVLRDIIDSLVAETFVAWNFEPKPVVTQVVLQTPDELAAAQSAFEADQQAYDAAVEAVSAETGQTPEEVVVDHANALQAQSLYGAPIPESLQTLPAKPVIKTHRPLVSLPAASNQKGRLAHKMTYVTYPAAVAPYDATEEMIAQHEETLSRAPSVPDHPEIVPAFLGQAVRLSCPGRQGIESTLESWIDSTPVAERAHQRTFRRHEVDEEAGWSVSFWVKPLVRGQRTDQRVAEIRSSDEDLISSVAVCITPDDRVKIISGRKLAAIPEPPVPEPEKEEEDEDAGEEEGEIEDEEEDGAELEDGGEDASDADGDAEEDAEEVIVPEDEDPLLGEFESPSPYMVLEGATDSLLAELDVASMEGVSTDAVIFGEWNLIVVSQKGVRRTLHVNGVAQPEATHYIGLARMWDWPRSDSEIKLSLVSLEVAPTSAQPKKRAAKTEDVPAIQEPEEAAEPQATFEMISNRVQAPTPGKIIFGAQAHPNLNVGFGGELTRIAVFDHHVSDSCVRALFLTSLYCAEGFFTSKLDAASEAAEIQTRSTAQAVLLKNNPLVDPDAAEVLESLSKSGVVPAGCTEPPKIGDHRPSKPAASTEEGEPQPQVVAASKNTYHQYMDCQSDDPATVRLAKEMHSAAIDDTTRAAAAIAQPMAVTTTDEVRADLLLPSLVDADCLILPPFRRIPSAVPSAEVQAMWRLGMGDSQRPGDQFFKQGFLGPEEKELLSSFVALQGRTLVVHGDPMGYSSAFLHELFPTIFPQFSHQALNLITEAALVKGPSVLQKVLKKRPIAHPAFKLAPHPQNCAIAPSAALSVGLPPSLPFASVTPARGVEPIQSLKSGAAMSLLNVLPYVPSSLDVKAAASLIGSSKGHVEFGDRINNNQPLIACHEDPSKPGVPKAISDFETGMGRSPFVSEVGAVPPELLPRSAAVLYKQGAVDCFTVQVGEGQVTFLGFAGSFELPADQEQAVADLREEVVSGLKEDEDGHIENPFDLAEQAEAEDELTAQQDAAADEAADAQELAVEEEEEAVVAARGVRPEEFLQAAGQLDVKVSDRMIAALAAKDDELETVMMGFKATGKHPVTGKKIYRNQTQLNAVEAWRDLLVVAINGPQDSEI